MLSLVFDLGVGLSSKFFGSSVSYRNVCILHHWVVLASLRCFDVGGLLEVSVQWGFNEVGAAGFFLLFSCKHFYAIFFFSIHVDEVEEEDLWEGQQEEAGRDGRKKSGPLQSS